MSRLLEQIYRAQEARRKAEQATASQQPIPAAEPHPLVTVVPTSGDLFGTAASQPADPPAAQRHLELEEAAARRTQRDAEALEQLKRREKDFARAAEASQSWLAAEAQQLDQARALEAEQAQLAQAAEAAAQLEEQAKLVAEKRLAAQARATEAAQRRQQAEERRAEMTRGKLDAEKALAVADAAHDTVERHAQEIREKRLADNAELGQLRSERHEQLAANVVRGVNVALVLIAFAVGVGIAALVGVWRSPAVTPTPTARPATQAGASVRRDGLVLKTDRDLEGFAARADKVLPQLQKR